MNNELISREDLQYKFDNLCPHIECKKCRWYSMVDSFHKCALIDNAPTVEIATKLQPNCNKLQPKQGERIIVDDTEKFIAKCSVCGRIEDSRMVKYHPFCHCGADMRGD